jgi:predicted Zn-dependent peptidase
MVKVLHPQRNYLLLVITFCLSFGAATGRALAQAEPQREQLLNGLRILIESRPGDPTVLLKLRIHSGAAFDRDGKAGTAALLGELLFPDQVTYDYFKDEMSGRLAISTDHDSITISLQGQAAEYDRIVDILRTALVTTPLSPENVLRIRDARIKALIAAKPSASEIADIAVANRLFGTFPYANPAIGTAESVARIERADVMLARERFLSPNNATLVIIGGVEQRRAMRALRQLLGGWRKSEELVPLTFRQPTQPDPRTLIANFPGSQAANVRLATRGLARGDRDFAAAALLAAIVRERWEKLLPESKANAFVRHEAHTLPGMFIMGVAVDNAAASKALETARTVLKSLVESPVLPSEIEKAKTEAMMALEASGDSKLSQKDKLANDWLNIEAYSLPPASDQMRTWNALSPADVQRVAVRLFRDPQIASVVVGNAENLKAQLVPAINIEVLGEAKTKSPEPPPTTTTPGPSKQRPFKVFTGPKTTHPLLKDPKSATKPD